MQRCSRIYKVYINTGREADEMKSLSLQSTLKKREYGEPPHMRCLLHTRTGKALGTWTACGKKWRLYRTPDLEAIDLARD